MKKTQHSAKMASSSRQQFVGAELETQEFANFVMMEVDGDVSEGDLTDDEVDAPSFPSDSQILNSESESEPDSPDEDDARTPEVEPILNHRRTYWKKVEDFSPLPPAPEHIEITDNAVNLAPNDYFHRYVPHDIIERLCNSTNQRHLRDTGRHLNCSVEEMKIFLSVTIVMSYLQFPRIRMYWARKTNIPVISKNMTRNRYFVIRKNLKLVDDDQVPVEEKQKNRFWKVEPILKSLRTACLLNDRSTSVCIDEQIIPFWGQISARQYIRGKPNPCGLKNFVLAAPDGLPLDFFLYQGKGDNITNDEEFKHLDIGGKTIMRLSESLPPGVTIYMDRYFTSIAVLDMLHARAECQGTGTLQKSRVPNNCTFKSDYSMRKERGSMDQAVRNDGQVCIVKWYDNKPIIIASSKEGQHSTDTCKRWSRKDGKYVTVPRPAAIRSYNTNMGGVDFLDRVISMYRIRARTKKWTVRLILHCIDFAIAASWIQYRRDQAALKTKKKDILDYLQFKENIQEHLLHGCAKENEHSSEDEDLEPKSKHPRTQVAIPSDALRTKNVLHLPEFPVPITKNRCRFPGCQANKARVRCSTCKVFLCLQDNRNCFKLFHEM